MVRDEHVNLLRANRNPCTDATLAGARAPRQGVWVVSRGSNPIVAGLRD
jgi:hypothetical protein